MPDDALTAALQDLLRDCAARETHTLKCLWTAVGEADLGVRLGRVTADTSFAVCTCDRAERVLARQARVVAAFTNALIDGWAIPEPYRGDWSERLELGLEAGRAALDAPEEET